MAEPGEHLRAAPDRYACFLRERQLAGLGADRRPELQRGRCR